ncbi:MAG: hypothetical protein IMZ50_02765 [Candidatus Atribacteria bacterium]|nr:hypothetical protein [Candidatus Atribacteria bacterium]
MLKFIQPCLHHLSRDILVIIVREDQIAQHGAVIQHPALVISTNKQKSHPEYTFDETEIPEELI